MVPCSLKQVNIYFFLLIHLTKEFVLIWPVDLLESVTFFVNRSMICVHMYTWVESSVIFCVCVYLIIFHRKWGGFFFLSFFWHLVLALCGREESVNEMLCILWEVRCAMQPCVLMLTWDWQCEWLPVLLGVRLSHFLTWCNLYLIIYTKLENKKMK